MQRWPSQKQLALPALLALTNAGPNVLWAVLGFVPIAVFGYSLGGRLGLCGLLACAGPASTASRN